ncbi:hypothetical protein A2U01_0027196, partial [Trifolium medium]|nr:hypothetical protein [Trifolium medium]
EDHSLISATATRKGLKSLDARTDPQIRLDSSVDRILMVYMMADVIANIIVIVTVATAAAVIYLARPILRQYLFPKQKIKAM